MGGQALAQPWYDLAWHGRAQHYWPRRCRTSRAMHGTRTLEPCRVVPLGTVAHNVVPALAHRVRLRHTSVGAHCAKMPCIVTTQMLGPQRCCATSLLPSTPPSTWGAKERMLCRAIAAGADAVGHDIAAGGGRKEKPQEEEEERESGGMWTGKLRGVGEICFRVCNPTVVVHLKRI